MHPRIGEDRVRCAVFAAGDVCALHAASAACAVFAGVDVGRTCKMSYICCRCSTCCMWNLCCIHWKFENARYACHAG
jgi:hypothetical protein